VTLKRSENKNVSSRFFPLYWLLGLSNEQPDVPGSQLWWLPGTSVQKRATFLAPFIGREVD